ncbi:MAG: hypothetical protein HYZ85_01090 [Candidatus Omnitrophica bacterium]|nr:hypothetical protein [Candidatus Omnitrophota bacterium]
MSSIYSQLSKNQLKIEKEQPSLLPTERLDEYKLTGIKTAIAGAFIFSLLGLAGAGYLFQRLNSEQRERQALEAVSQEFRSRAEVVQVKAAELETIVMQYRQEIDGLKNQLKSSAAERNEIKQALEKSNRSLTSLQKKMADLEARSRAIEDETAFIRTSAVPGAAMEGRNAAQAQTPKTFQVLTINRKFNFVVVNVGLKDKVKMGSILEIQRAGKKIGKVQVEKVYENFSAAAVVEEPKDAPFKEGDLVGKIS